MSKKALILTVVVWFFSACEIQADVIHSSWVGGEADEWARASNWDSSMVPDNSSWRTFAVTIDSNSIGVDHVYVRLQQNRTVDQLECYGQVELANGTSDWIDLALIDPNGLTNYGELEIEGEYRMEINGNITNATGAELGLWGMIFIGTGDLHNSTGATIEVGGVDIGVDDGSLENNGDIVIRPESEFGIDKALHNTGQINIYGGQCESETFDNNSTGIIWGFGYVAVDQLLRNEGKIYASGGTLAVICEGSVINTGTLQNGPLSSLHIKPAEDVNNSGTIEVNADGGVAFDCNLVDEPNAIIKLLGGTLAANRITQRPGAIFEGFGGVTGDIVIEPGGAVQLTGPTSIVGDVAIEDNAVMEISDATTLITGQTTCNGTIHIKGGRIIPQGGLSGDCNIVWEPGTYTNVADFNLDGQVNLKDFAAFADTWLWQTGWR